MLLRSLIKNHPLVDGNKRVAMATTALFLLMNRYLLIASAEEMVRFALDLATSEPDMDWREVSRWVKAHSIPISDAQTGLRQVQETLADQADVLQRVMDRWIEIVRYVL